MTLSGTKANNAQNPSLHDATAPLTKQRQVTLTVTQAHADASSGSPLNITSSWTDLAANVAPRVLLITLGAGSETVYTVTGTGESGASQSENVTVAASGSASTRYGYKAITSVTTSTDPGATSEFDWSDTLCDPAARSCHVGTSGDIACILEEDTAAVTVPSVPAGEFPRKLKRINITGTTASGLVLGW